LAQSNWASRALSAALAARPGFALFAAMDGYKDPGIDGSVGSTVGTHISQYHNAAALQLAKPDRNSLVVRACGRSVMLPAGITCVGDIQGVLQVELGMRDQQFEIYDANGMQIMVDADIQTAIMDRRLPFTATLQDASIHFIENRREELAQMQWKLVRDQSSQLSLKLQAVCRQVTNMETVVEAEKRERERGFERFQQEMVAALESIREGGRGDCRQLDERLAGVGHLISAERNMREASLQRLVGDTQSVRESLTVDRNAWQQGNKETSRQFEDMRKAVALERSLREAFEERHRLDMVATRERMDEMTTGLQHVINDYGRAFEKASSEINDVIEGHFRTHQKGKNEIDLAQQDVVSRVAYLEERNSTLEQRHGDTQQRQQDMIERLNQRSEKCSQAVEMLRFEGGKHASLVSNFAAQLEKQDVSTNQLMAETRDALMTERRRREEETRTLKDTIMTEHGTLIGSLEGKMAARFERESAAREGNVSELLSTFQDSGRKELPIMINKDIMNKEAATRTADNNHYVVESRDTYHSAADNLANTSSSLASARDSRPPSVQRHRPGAATPSSYVAPPGPQQRGVPAQMFSGSLPYGGGPSGPRSARPSAVATYPMPGGAAYPMPGVQNAFAYPSVGGPCGTPRVASNPPSRGGSMGVPPMTGSQGSTSFPVGAGVPQAYR
jgi:hypothetical protein